VPLTTNLASPETRNLVPTPSLRLRTTTRLAIPSSPFSSTHEPLLESLVIHGGAITTAVSPTAGTLCLLQESVLAHETQVESELPVRSVAPHVPVSIVGEGVDGLDVGEGDPP
jgi:hypothetical protein